MTSKVTATLAVVAAGGLFTVIGLQEACGCITPNGNVRSGADAAQKLVSALKKDLGRCPTLEEVAAQRETGKQSGTWPRFFYPEFPDTPFDPATGELSPDGPSHRGVFYWVAPDGSNCFVRGIVVHEFWGIPYSRNVLEPDPA